MKERDQPLSLTIHSMPEPASDEQIDSSRTRKGRIWLMVVFFMCAAPVVASYFTYYVIQPQGEPRFGELIRPTRAIPDVTTQDAQAKPHRLTELRKQWLLISVDSGACGTACQQKLYYQRQILAGLGKERDRTEWVWLIHDDHAISPELLTGLKEATVLRIGVGDVKGWFQEEDPAGLSKWLYLIDPMGEWMMRFPSDLDPSKALQVRKDMERLLRASSSWDTAGR